MAKVLNKVMQSKKAPTKADLWISNSGLKANIKGKWQSIGGIPIVKSLKELNRLNLPTGSLASVAFSQGKGSVIDITECYQPGEQDFVIDNENMTIKLNNADRLTSVSGVKIEQPADFAIPEQGAAFIGILVGQEVIDLLSQGISKDSIEGGEAPPDIPVKLAFIIFEAVPNSPMPGIIGIAIESLEDLESLGGILGGNPEEGIEESMKKLMMAMFTEEGIVINQPVLDDFNAKLARGPYTMLINLGEMIGMPGEVDTSFVGQVLKVITGNAANSTLYEKKNGWEEFGKKELTSLEAKLNLAIASATTDKADRSKVVNLANLELEEGEEEVEKQLQPNTYYTDTVSVDGPYNVTLLGTEGNYFGEYALELKVQTPAMEDVIFCSEDGNTINIQWLNGIPPTFVEGTTVIISIVRGFGVFGIF